MHAWKMSEYWVNCGFSLKRWCLILYDVSWQVRTIDFAERKFKVEWREDKSQFKMWNSGWQRQHWVMHRSVCVSVRTRVNVCIPSNKLTWKIMIPQNRSTPLTSMKTKEGERERTREKIERGYATCVYFNYKLLSNPWITSCLSGNLNKIMTMQEISNCHLFLNR